MKRDQKNVRTTRDVLISILIGASIAFLSALLEGTLQLLEGYGNNVVGGSFGSVVYIIRKAIS